MFCTYFLYINIPYTICRIPKPKAQNNKPCPGKNKAITPRAISEMPKNLTTSSVYFSAQNNETPYTKSINGATSI